ncbi:hypothetical protein D3C87_1760780 [compost metagenome]
MGIPRPILFLSLTQQQQDLRLSKHTFNFAFNFKLDHWRRITAQDSQLYSIIENTTHTLNKKLTVRLGIITKSFIK